MEKRTNRLFLFCPVLAFIFLVISSDQNLKSTPGHIAHDQTLPDKKITFSVGPVKISTYNPVTITGLEYSTNFYFDAKNTSSKAVTLRMTSLAKIINSLPNWVIHFLAYQPEAVEIGPGKVEVLEYLITNEGLGTTTLPFTFKVDETAKQKTMRLKIRSTQSPSLRDISNTAQVNITVLSSDRLPLANLDVNLFFFNGREGFRESTDSQGIARFLVPSVADIRKAFGPRPLPYRALDYYLVVDADGYELRYQDNITTRPDEPVNLEVTLDPVQKPSYDLIGELTTSSPHGYFWLLPDQSFTRLAAVQGRHPPELKKPGHIIMTSNDGRKLWKLKTNDECWGFDVVRDRVSAGCHDGSVYVTDLSGSLLLQFNCGGMNREVELNPTAKKIFTGPYMGEDAALLDIATGKAAWTYHGAQQWLRNSRFSPDGKSIVAGFSGGKLVMFSNGGKVLWDNYIGEFPLMLEMDKRHNVYAAGKNRELFSFDRKGTLRWRCRIPDHVVTAGSNNMSQDGSLIAFGTVGGMIYAFDQNGEIRWRRRLTQDAVLLGHNALDVTPDGKWIAAGTAGDTRSVLIYNDKGTLLWRQDFTDRRDPGQYDHNQTGAITVAISDDGSMIAAGFGDSVLRFFRRK